MLRDKGHPGGFTVTFVPCMVHGPPPCASSFPTTLGVVENVTCSSTVDYSLLKKRVFELRRVCDLYGLMSLAAGVC